MQAHVRGSTCFKSVRVICSEGKPIRLGRLVLSKEIWLLFSFENFFKGSKCEDFICFSPARTGLLFSGKNLPRIWKTIGSFLHPIELVTLTLVWSWALHAVTAKSIHDQNESSLVTASTDAYVESIRFWFSSKNKKQPGKNFECNFSWNGCCPVCLVCVRCDDGRNTAGDLLTKKGETHIFGAVVG